MIIVVSVIYVAEWTSGFEGGKIIIKNSTFNNLNSNLFICDNINIDYSIINNKISNSNNYDVLIDDEDYSIYGFYENSALLKRATYKISGNIFETYAGEPFIFPGGVSIYMLDMRTAVYPEENMPMKFMVENNIFKLHEGAKGIVGVNNKDAMILANKFVGTGVTGITLNGEGEAYSLNNKILGNNFSMADYETDIYLGLHTKNCLVAGSPMAVIVNEGVGNRITGKP